MFVEYKLKTGHLQAWVVEGGYVASGARGGVAEGSWELGAGVTGLTFASPPALLGMLLCPHHPLPSLLTFPHSKPGPTYPSSHCPPNLPTVQKFPPVDPKHENRQGAYCEKEERGL